MSLVTPSPKVRVPGVPPVAGAGASLQPVNKGTMNRKTARILLNCRMISFWFAPGAHFKNVLIDVGRTERSEFRHCVKKPELTLFVPAYEPSSLKSCLTVHSLKFTEVMLWLVIS